MMDGSIWKGALFSALLLTAAVWDIRRREIPDWIPLLIFLTGIPQMNPPDAFSGLVATGLPYLLAAVLSYKREGSSIGGGDIKLTAAMGFAFGLNTLAAILLLALLPACIYAKATKQRSVPLAVFLCVGAFSFAVVVFVFSRI
jgi:leader peptidase (prepilin peptidase)/N-methyltransferase